MRLQPDRRPATGTMLTELDAALGGRLTVLDCLREVAEEYGRVCFPIVRLWEEHCAGRLESKTAPADDPLEIGSSPPADPPIDIAPRSLEAAPPPVDGFQNALFAEGELAAVKAPAGPAQSIYVHFGNPAEFSIIDLAKKIVDLTGSRSARAFRPLPFNDPKRRRPDVSLAAKRLDWKPVTSLEDGLMKTIEYFRGGNEK